MKTKFPSLLTLAARYLSGAMLALMLAGVSVQALPTVTTLGGGDPNVSPKYLGYRNGDTLHTALFHTPSGLAITPDGSQLLVADRDNNAVRLVDFSYSPSLTFDLLVYTNYVEATNLYSKPVGLALDLSGNLFVLNFAKGTNGYILQFDADGELIATNLAKITNAAGMALDSQTNIYLTASNKVIKVATSTGVSSVIATINDAGSSLQGIVYKRNGMLAVCDAGRNGIYFINPNSGAVTTNAGFHGPGDFISASDTSISNNAKLFHPYALAETGDGTLIVSDNGNNRIKAVLTSGAISNICGVGSNYWGGTYPGWYDGPVVLPDSVAPNVQCRLPNGIAYAFDGTIYIDEDYYHTIRKVTGASLALMPPPPQPPPAPPTNLSATTNFNVITLSWTGSSGATNYNVKRSQSTNGPFTTIGSTAGTSFTDSTVPPGATRSYVVTALNAFGESANSAVITVTLPFLPVPDPQIGYLNFVPLFGSQFVPVETSVTFNNDRMIVIEGAAGSTTRFIASNTVDVASIGDPSSGSTAPSGYQDQLSESEAAAFVVAQPMPALSIKAIGIQTNHPNSGVVSAQFLFVAGTPQVLGNNAALFTVSDVTTGADLIYTLDGSDPSPTNANAVDLGILTGTNTSWSITFGLQADTKFIARAFKTNYQPSDPVTNTFTVAQFLPTTMSFGFAVKEGSSAFVASPGQTFYAPVTLSLVGSPTIYTLQFNLVVTNGPVNSGPPIPPGSFGFQSLLEKPIPGISPTVFESIPPAQFVGLASVPNPITLDGSSQFTSLLTTNTGLNLLGVGWIERATETNLYDTTKQTLISFSQAHDTVFTLAGGKVIVGGFNVVIPQTAQSNQTYQIQIGRVSDTVDGVGDTSIFIDSPTNGGTGAGTINALKYITVGQRKYIAGSVTPFNWFNAGDFGTTNISDPDVVQVFQSAVYFLNTPPAGSDFFDAMDSSGEIGAFDADNADPNFGHYTNSQAILGSINPLFDGNDTTINQDIFGDGFLDVSDVYVTFRRSLDPSLALYQRFWNNNGQRIADSAPNIAKVQKVASGSGSGTVTPKVQSSSTNPPPFVSFSAGDIVGSAGQTVQIPINATIIGKPLRVLMLNLTVTPLDGSPVLASQVSFNQTATVLGAPYITDSKGLANYSSVWLNSTNTGLSNSVTIGTLSVAIPATAGASAAYAVHFDHASASPNGLASFPNAILSGVLSTSVRTNSCYNDGIPDSWRLRWFGTTNNLLSVSNACPSGDGINNWAKYIAGVDPSKSGDFPQTKTKSPAPSGYNSAIHWPTVNGKKYVIERSSTLFNTPWSILNTNIGTGNDMEYDDSYTNKTKFYRVLILP